MRRVAGNGRWLTAQLVEQFAGSAKLEGEIKQNLANLGYGGQQL